MKRLFGNTAALGLALLAAACAPGPAGERPEPPVAPAEGQPSAAERAQTQVLFGDLHLHTAWSFDAFTYKTVATPEEAYNYAEGKPLKAPSGMVYQLSRPLDFLAVTDHSEFVGVMARMADPSSPLAKLPIAKTALDPDFRTSREAFVAVGAAFRTGDLSIFGDQQGALKTITADTWTRAIEIANRHNKPGKFTTLIAYEWTSADEGRNLHRNVIFGGDSAPLPFTSVDSKRPEDLWKYLDAARRGGAPVLAIPHNSNLSDGAMFALLDSDGQPITADYSRTRARNEPLVEITQHKGTSETHPSLSPNDEFADFELVETYVGTNRPVTRFEGGYVRDALRRGIGVEDRQGVNPFKLGIVAATDSHVGMSPVEEDHYQGGSGIRDATGVDRLECTYCAIMTDISKNSASGLTAVWARANTRPAIFQALSARETYGTTGPRMQVRFFGGRLGGVRPGSAGWVEAAYRLGVPMGGTLPADRGAPSFVVWAVKDAIGANLDRVQIVKVWSKAGVSHEKVFDVALSGGRKVDRATGKAPPVGNTVDVAKATYSNTIGAVTLTANWTDPEFDRTARAAYYVRVLEIPTPRWSTYDAVRMGRAIPRGLAATIQERAFTSPIWVSPAG